MAERPVEQSDVELVLASGSPRRRQLLGELGLPFRVVVSDVDESPLAGEPPRDLVLRLARAKAEAVAALAPNAVVVAADTIAVLDGEVLGKPIDEADAAAMLQRMSGTTHEVLTGVAVLAAGELQAEVAVSRVRFAPMTTAEITDYVATGEPLDKAGAYGIQGEADRFATLVDGAFDNVVGLPLALVRRLLATAGITVTRT
ncbi:MAG TPA: Maf family protein [Acidimicrobiales bacterium]